jgi:hypothetical protein
VCYMLQLQNPKQTWVHTKIDILSVRPFPGWSSSLVPCPPSTSPAWVVC